VYNYCPWYWSLATEYADYLTVTCAFRATTNTAFLDMILALYGYVGIQGPANPTPTGTSIDNVTIVQHPINIDSLPIFCINLINPFFVPGYSVLTNTIQLPTTLTMPYCRSGNLLLVIDNPMQARVGSPQQFWGPGFDISITAWSET
jgi:hypothetical protein